MVGAVLKAYGGVLGVDGRNRNYFVLDGITGRYLTGSAPEPEGGVAVTPNITTALRGEVGDDSSVTPVIWTLPFPSPGAGSSMSCIFWTTGRPPRA